MEERGLVGLEARTEDGVEAGRITEVVTDEQTGEVTHVMVERDEEQYELPISSVTLDPDAEFATFHSDRSDIEPGDHVGDEVEPEGYAPAESDEEDDYRHEGQFVTEPTDPDDARSAEDLARESGEADGWEDEGSTPADSGYPRTDAYIDPETGETTEGYTDAGDTGDLDGAVAAVLEDTGLQANSISDGVVEILGRAPDSTELDRVAAEVMALEEVFEVDTSGVEVG